jgi:hypothetical protein
MPQDVYNTWQDLAKAASVERDSKKLAYLVERMLVAFDDEERKTRPRQMSVESDMVDGGVSE